MPYPEPPYTGACLCGSVQVIASAAPLLTLACHCLDCQKLSASAYSLTTMFARSRFSHTGDLIKGGLGSDGRAHFFCKSCLNFVFTRIQGAPDRVNLRSSILKDAAAFEPFVELMTDEKMPWAHVPAIHSFAQFPKSLEDLQFLMDEYAARRTPAAPGR
ncbi:MAG: GFA family protein [Sulfitobacter sp.]